MTVKQQWHRIWPIVGIWIAVSLLLGCSDTGSNRGNTVLIQVEDVIVTVSDFTQAFEILNAGSHLVDADDKGELTDARLAFLNQMTEEMLLIVRAGELAIEVTDEELEAAAAAIKADYPEGEFEQVLLEYAVPYRFWLKRLRVRLLMDKVIARELGARITITPEDIAAYYQAHYANQDEQEDSEQEGYDLEQEDYDLEASIVQQLRREKTETAYGPWIQNLKEKYPVDINKQEWEHIIGS